MARSDFQSDGYTIQGLEMLRPADALETIRSSLSRGFEGSSADRALGNSLLHAACEKQPWTSLFEEQFRQTLECVDLVETSQFQWVKLAKDIVCTLLPDLGTRTSNNVLNTHVDAVHAAVHKLYSPEIDGQVSSQLFGAEDAEDVDPELFQAVASMRDAFVNGRSDRSCVVDCLHLWPLELPAHDLEGGNSKSDPFSLPEFTVSLAEGGPLQALRAKEEAVTAVRIAAEQATKAAVEQAAKTEQAIKAAAEQAAMAASQQATAPGMHTPADGGALMPNPQVVAPAAAAPAQAVPAAAAAAAAPDIAPYIDTRIAGHKRQRSPEAPQPDQVPSAGQLAYTKLLATYPGLGTDTREALHAFLVQRKVGHSVAPPGLTEQGFFDYLLDTKQELDKKGRMFPYRYEMRLYFDGTGKYMQRKVKVKSARGIASTVDANASQ